MNKLKFLPLLCLSLLFFTLTSCSKEDDNNNAPASIEGIWKFDTPDEDDYLYWILNKNVLVLVESGDPTPDYYTYEYDEEEQVLVVVYDIEGPSEFKVVELTSNKLELQAGDETGTFTRYNGTLRDLEKELDIEIEL